MTDDNTAPSTLDDDAGTRSRLTPLLVGCVLLVAALVVAWLVWRELDSRGDLLDAGREAEAAGREVAVNMLTYDHRTLDEDFAWVESDGTPRFQEAFGKSAADVREIAEATSATSEGKVIGSGVHVDGAGRATVIVAADSQIAQPGRPAPSSTGGGSSWRWSSVTAAGWSTG